MINKLLTFIGTVIGITLAIAIGVGLIYMICLFLRGIIVLMMFLIPFMIVMNILFLPLNLWALKGETESEKARYFSDTKRYFREGIVLIPAFVGGFAPPYTLIWLINEFLIEIPVSFFDMENESWTSMYLDKTIGVLGIVFAVAGAFYASAILRRQARQIENLATSKVRAAAIGLAEFSGVARPVEPEKLDASERGRGFSRKAWPGVPSDTILLRGYKSSDTGDSHHVNVKRRFYIEDDSGRILVDPREAEFDEGMRMWFLESARKILLREHEWKDETASYEANWLSAGDPVYLIGNVEENADAGNAADIDRLVVRPSTSPVSFGALWRFVLGTEKNEPGKEFRDIFLLSDRREQQVRDQLLSNSWNVWALSLFWIVPSVVLLALV